MKKILYICLKPIENWDIFTPLASKDVSQIHASVLLLHNNQDLENIPVSQVWKLGEGDLIGLDKDKNISYQDFLEQVFLHDLPMVI